MIPFLDLKAPHVELRDEIRAAIDHVVSSGWYILGPEVEAFEAEYAGYCNANHAVGVANGLDALHIALRAMDVGAGDEVIVPSFTFVSTALAFVRQGAKVVFADSRPDHPNMDLDSIEHLITKRTKAIVPVHYAGIACDMDKLKELAPRIKEAVGPEKFLELENALYY